MTLTNHTAIGMLVAAALIGVASWIAKRWGAGGVRRSGLLTPFPITSTILVAFTHHGECAAAASGFLRGLLKGLFSFAVFVLVVGVAIGSWSIAATFGMATLVTIVFHSGVWHWVQHPVPAPSAAGSPPL